LELISAAITLTMRVSMPMKNQQAKRALFEFSTRPDANLTAVTRLNRITVLSQSGEPED
jgi:hypothetical protein